MVTISSENQQLSATENQKLIADSPLQKSKYESIVNEIDADGSDGSDDSDDKWFFNNFEYTVKECLFAIAAYIAIGTLAFSYVFEKWPIVDSMYFSVVTFTTIGYGDFHPTTDAGRLFTCFWAISGVSILGIALGVVGHNIIEANVTSLEEKRKDAEKHTLETFGTAEQVDEMVESSALSTTTIIRYVFVAAFLIGGASLMAVDQGWDWTEAVYYFVITSATVGYGDLTPQTERLRLFAVVYILVAVSTMGEFLGAISSAIVEKRQNHFFSSLMEHEFNFNDLKIMDIDDDGEVSELEFVIFMLKSMRKVDEELLLDLRARFKELDITGDGSLSIEDLLEDARIKNSVP
mmetsp:Transcript_57489/g.67130  ORF Transcript_57489/g.67130 Transcript_57489/m.67130 type:complete len:349 (+) Transcript_57489:118-1164(+)